MDISVGGGSSISVGDKVEAKCKGSARHYPGKVRRDNGDGTYYVLFDDGDKDPAVPERDIKSEGGKDEELDSFGGGFGGSGRSLSGTTWGRSTKIAV